MGICGCCTRALSFTRWTHGTRAVRRHSRSIAHVAGARRSFQRSQRSAPLPRVPARSCATWRPRNSTGGSSSRPRSHGSRSSVRPICGPRTTAWIRRGDGATVACATSVRLRRWATSRPRSAPNATSRFWTRPARSVATCSCTCTGPYCCRSSSRRRVDVSSRLRLRSAPLTT